ncbi:MAG: glycine/sarcosine/betaine reductase selenoprotein B family protein [Nitriliruptoraceae bacterium]
MPEADEHRDGEVGASPDDPPMTMTGFRESFYYGEHADMQFKYLARLDDARAAEAIAAVLATVGEVVDTGDLDVLRARLFALQVAAYAPDGPVEPTVEDAPFAPLGGPLAEQRLALLTAGGVFDRDDDPMGPDGPSQAESLSMIQDFLRGTPTLSTIAVGTPPDRLTARHPGYDARTAQRDPDTVFPLTHLRAIAAEGRVKLADEHYAFTGATSQRRLEKQVAPRWAEHMAAREIDVCFLVAT